MPNWIIRVISSCLSFIFCHTIYSEFIAYIYACLLIRLCRLLTLPLKINRNYKKRKVFFGGVKGREIIKEAFCLGKFPRLIWVFVLSSILDIIELQEENWTCSFFPSPGKITNINRWNLNVLLAWHSRLFHFPHFSICRIHKQIVSMGKQTERGHVHALLMEFMHGYLDYG